MRYAVVAISTALLIGVFSACTSSDTGSTGISCTGSGEATKKFIIEGEEGTEANAQYCLGAYGNCLAVPQTFDLTIDGGEGSSFCTTPGTPTSLELISVRAANLVSEAPCNETHEYQYGYTFQSRGDTWPSGPKGTFSLYVRGDTSIQLATAQFCYDTNSSGHYKLFAEDGSTQTGTWCFDCMNDSP